MVADAASRPREKEGALARLRVLEIGEFEAAAYCGKLFADLGAEVIKVERPGGDPARLAEPLVEVGEGRRESAFFAWLNTNKQSVSASGPDEDRWLHALAAACDVVIDGRDQAAAVQWREELIQRRPATTLVSLSWFGENGPYRDFKATDATVRALSGVVWPAGAPGEPPLLLNDHQASVVGGLNAFTAALAAQLSPRRGRAFEVSLLEAQLALSEFYAVIAQMANEFEVRVSRNRFRPTFPMGVYPTREGWIGLTVASLDQWRGFCDLMELPEDRSNPDFDPAMGRFASADALEAKYAPRLLEKTAAEWFSMAFEMRLPFAIVPTMAELSKQSVHRQRGAFAEVKIGDASFEAPALPQRLTVPAQPANGIAPLAGQHTARWRTPLPRAADDQPVAASDHTRPLNGIRIVDLTMGWAGPLATRQMADLGAEIIKVESCGYADWWRTADSRPDAVRERQFEKSAIFNSVNRNKKGITLDLTRKEGADLLLRLVATADAVIENYSHGVLPKLGLSFPQLRAVNSSLVMVSMPAFGGETEWADARAYGSTLEHASGIPMLAGAPDDPPTMTHLALGDPIGGLNAAAALLAALFHRAKSGEGQHVDLSQVQCLFPLVAPWAIEQAVTGSVVRWGARHPRFSPHGAFRCYGEDEWIVLAVTNADEWQRLCGVLGRKHLAQDDSTASIEGRRAIEPSVHQAITAWCSTRTPDEAMQTLQAAGVPSGAVRRPGELQADPHLQARGAWAWVERPWIGLHSQTLAAFREDGAPYPVLHPSPLLGEFNASVLSEVLGLSDAEIADLAASGIIGWEVRPTTRTNLRAPA